MKKQLTKLGLAAAIAVFAFAAGCDANDNANSSSSACTHSGGTATCTEAAVCELCGESYGEALGHSYATEWTADETQHWHACACGDKADAADHTWVEGAITDPTCTETGAQAYTCECGATKSVEIDALGHTYESVVTAPTCTEAGYTTYTCACGDTYTADEVAATGHNHEAAVTAPTCTEAGYTTYTCACGDTYTGNEVAALGHTYETAVTAPTCTEAGYTTYTCACGDAYTADEVAALGHTFIDSVCHCGAEYVAAPATGSWTLITELKNGEEVLIGAPAYGKLLSAEKVSSGSYYNKGVNYSEDDFSNVTNAEIFTVTVNADGTYTFTSLTGKVIALADSYSSLNDTGTHKSWALTDRGDGTFLMKNTGRNLYLEWYSSKNNWSTYSAGNTTEYYLSFYAMQASAGDHVHNHISEVHAPTCTEAGYTSYTCDCGDTYNVDGAAATGHTYEETVVPPTCTEDGYTAHTCACGDTYTDNTVEATGHNFVDDVCSVCGHTHTYEAVVTEPTCTAAGYTTHTCACGETYTDSEVEKLGHIDENLDIDCDRAGCTSKVAPPADSVLSTFTANCLGSKLSTSYQYYVVGTIVEVLDAKNGIFLIDDGSGETFYFRLPKNAEGTSHSSWTVRLTLGDKVQVYGKLSKYSSTSAPNGQYWPAIQGGVVTILEQHEHVFTPTCTKDGVCACLTVGPAALGHIDEDASGFCDRCEWNMNFKLSKIVIATDPTLANGVQTMGSDNKAAAWTWSDDAFDAVIAKGTSTVTLYTTAKPYMQLKKLNTFTLTNKNNVSIKTITLSVTTASYLTNLETVLTGAGLTFTKNETDLTATIEWNSTENFEISNTSANTIYISGVEVVYE